MTAVPVVAVSAAVAARQGAGEEAAMKLSRATKHLFIPAWVARHFPPGAGKRDELPDKPVAL